ncbi:MAG TPA: hypothetical protein DCW90_05600 [Lachnospiraceae bacterium]|nr:hypothetical protein [Lachnospiraceae bacterium]
MAQALNHLLRVDRVTSYLLYGCPIWLSWFVGVFPMGMITTSGCMEELPKRNRKSFSKNA